MKHETDGRADVAGWTDEFVDTVFPAEYETIRARREEVARRVASSRDPAATPASEPAHEGRLVPSVGLRLFGLAFSGGGIRSATFNLGIVQALAKRGLLRRFDYLSTVSGGGYLGSCLSSLLNRPDADSTWSREFPFYLESGRQEPVALRHLRDHSEYLVSSGTVGYFGMIAVLLRGMLVNIVAMLPFVVVAVALTHLMYGVGFEGGIRGDLPRFAVTLSVVAAFGVAVALFPLLTWMTHRRREPFGMTVRRRAGAVYAQLLKLIAVLALIEGLPLILEWHLESSANSQMLEGATWLSVVGTIAPQFQGERSREPGVMQRILDLVTLLAVSAVGPLLLLTAYVVTARWVLFSEVNSVAAGMAPWVVYGTGAALLVYTLLFLDANATSIHQFYRDRLSQAYLFDVDPADRTKVRSTDPLRMSSLNAQGTVAPYHLINTTLNLQGSEDVELRGRQADFFTFGKHHIGGVRTGYSKTTDMEQADRRVSLGTAMAISAAAAAPNMGALTFRPLSLVMMLLNIRLGYWLVHPERTAERSGLLRNIGVGVGQLLAEGLSRTTARGRYVNVSDGGHLENLAIYELLRRRCRVILCGDGEADPDMAFNGLATVIRFAATDMGVHIDIDLEGIAADADGRSKRHHAIGRIDYGDGEVGWLLYIKLSMGEHELPYIEEYRHANPDFPHQSTADQFFDEAQFEAYRALGFKVGQRTMAALGELAEIAQDEEVLEFGVEVGRGVEPSGDEDQGMEMDGRLSRSHQAGVDPEPPW